MVFLEHAADLLVVGQFGRLAAVPFVPLHAGQLSEWLSRDERELFYTSSQLPFPCPPERIECFYKENFSKGKYEFFSIFDAESCRHIGHFEIKNISLVHHSGTLGHVLLGDRQYRGRGLGRDVVRLMASVGFECLQLARVGLSVHVVNAAAVCAYVRGGFMVEGVVRDVLEKDGKRYSLYQMGMLRSEWDRTDGERKKEER